MTQTQFLFAITDPVECGKWGSHGVEFGGGNWVTCHLMLNSKGANGCEDIYNDTVKKVCQRWRSSFR